MKRMNAGTGYCTNHKLHCEWYRYSSAAPHVQRIDHRPLLSSHSHSYIACHCHTVGPPAADAAMSAAVVHTSDVDVEVAVVGAGSGDLFADLVAVVVGRCIDIAGEC